MLLTNYDFYDIYWSIVLMRSENHEYHYDVTKAIKDVVDAEQKDTIVEFNTIRKALSRVQELKENSRWQWILTENYYTGGIQIIKDDIAYQILSAMLEELLTCLRQQNSTQIYALADALHNIPIILVDNSKHPKRRIAREISSYRSKWNPCFLKDIMKNKHFSFRYK